MESKEIKSKQICVAVTPTIQKNFKKIMIMQQKKANTVLNDYIENYINAHKDLIKKYDQTFSDET